MTLPANIRVNIGAPFPALIKGSAAVAISKQNGIWTVGLNFVGLVKAAAIPDPVNAYVLVWNALTGVFTMVLATAVGPAGNSITPTIVAFAQSPYVPLAADQLLLVDTTGGPVVINLTASATRAGVALEVKDDKRNANVNAITVNRNGAELIDGDVAVVLDARGVAMKFAPKIGGYAIV
jgi:hypothetical protein